MRKLLLALAIALAADLTVAAGGNLVFGHGAIAEQIAAVTRAIEADPANARNYWHRGELYHEHGEFAAAESDLVKALELQPSLHGVHLSRARLLLEAGRPDAALVSADRFLDRYPADTDGRWTRAEALAACGRVDDAIDDMDFAIAHEQTPQPDRYLSRARLVRSRGTAADIALAVAGLDEGVRRLGAAAVLQLYAVELEEQLGRNDAGLAVLGDARRRFEGKEKRPARTDEAEESYLAAPNVTRGPYLSIGTPGGVVIRWRTDTPSDSRVRYGDHDGTLNWTTDDSTLTTEHEVELTGLLPDTRYYYSVGSIAAALAGNDGSHYFRTHPTPGTRKPVRVWAIGDSGNGNQNARAVRDAYLAYPGSASTDVWLMLGDNAYNTGLDSEYQTAVFDTYPQLLRNTILWPTRGNHDQIHAGANNDYYDIFTLPPAGQAGGVASGTEAYYSFDFANVHFMCLDSQGSSRAPGSAMLMWAALDLAATSQEWIIAYWHHPPYTKGSHDSDSETQLIEMRENVLPILEAGGVDLVLAGHSHSYERSFLIDEHYGLSSTLADSMKLDAGDGYIAGDGAYVKPTAGAAPHEGTVYAVAGSSAMTSGGTLDHPAMIRSLNRLGSLVIDILGNQLDATFINENGLVLDSFRIVKGIAVSAGDPPPPGAFALEQNAPNPFNPTTTIGFFIPYPAFVELAVYDAAGRRVATLVRGHMPAGRWTAGWNGRRDRGGEAPSGVYFYRLTAASNVETKKMVLLK